MVSFRLLQNIQMSLILNVMIQGKKSMMNKDGGKTMTGHEGHTMGMMTEEVDFNTKVEKSFQPVIEAYINLKDALVKEDSISTSANATTLLNKLNKVDMKLLSDNKAHNHWMSLEGEIKSSATSISETSDIKSQRDHFKHLSSHLINAVQLFGINEKVSL